MWKFLRKKVNISSEWKVVRNQANRNGEFTPKQKVIDSLAKDFDPKPDYKWCVESDSFDESSPTGLLFVKVPKTASSTISGVAERISRKYGNHSKC